MKWHKKPRPHHLIINDLTDSQNYQWGRTPKRKWHI